MKTKSKKYFFVLTCFLVLVMGSLLFKKPVLRWVHSPVDPTDTITITPSRIMDHHIPTDAKRVDTIIIGHVKKTGDPYFVEEMILRNVEISVDKTLKGDTDTTLIVVIQGGQIGRKKIVMRDEPSFASGENVLLFLNKYSQRTYSVFNGSYGTYFIDKDNQVTSIGGFVTDLDDLEAQIKDELENGEPLAPQEGK